MSGKYDDIIDLPHHVSETRPQMSMHDRAAQFTPFAALRGHKEAIDEIDRITEEKAELSEDQKAVLDMKQQILMEIISEEPEVTIIYFVPDKRKNGGKYVTVTGNLRRLDEFAKVMILADDTRIPFDDVVNIESDRFSGLLE